MVYALLDGPSLSGAYRFAIRRGEGVVMDVDNALFIRKDIHRLGVAPLTSMFWFAEYNRGRMVRSEEHTSELQSLMRISYAVFCLKKKKKHKNKEHTTTQ